MITVTPRSCDPRIGPRHLRRAATFWACRTVAERLQLVGEVVEAIPAMPGSADITALVADRIARETLTGLVLRRSRSQPSTA
jgi:agmatinase